MPKEESGKLENRGFNATQEMAPELVSIIKEMLEFGDHRYMPILRAQCALKILGVEWKKGGEHAKDN